MRDSGTGCRELVSKRGCAFDILCMQNQGHNTQCHTPNVTWKSNKNSDTLIKLRQQICRGEQRSPVEETSPRLQPLQDRTKKLSYHACRGWRPRQPARRCNAVIVVSLMPNYFRGTLLWYSPIIQRARNSGLSHFCELANRNFAKPLQFWNYNKFWTRATQGRSYIYSG